MVLADQFNATWLGCAGHSQALTPHLDEFAARSVSFERAYCQNPICTPSRVSILSGQYCQNHGYFGLSGPAPRLDNMFRHFKRNGYRTAAFGKLHLPESPRNWIADDVDVFGDTYESADGVFGCSDFLLGLEKKGIRQLEDSWHNLDEYGSASIAIDSMPSKLPLAETMEMWSVREAARFMDSRDDQPFCLQIAMQKPHHPLLPNERFLNLYPSDLSLPATWDQSPQGRPPHFIHQWEEWRRFKGEFATEGETYEDFLRRNWRGTLACVSQVDHAFGELMKELRQRNLQDNTIVVFGSDHGAYHGQLGIMEKAPGICSESVCRVPQIWHVPGLTKSGKVSRQFVENVDMLPTLSSLCGLPDFDSADGVDISLLLGENDEPVKEFSITENVWSKAICWEKWRFVHYQRDSFQGKDVGELYDIENDPLENQNLYFDTEYSAVVQECRRLIMEWLIRTRRTVTTHTALREPKLPSYTRDVSFNYPRCDDGNAPSALQACNRDEIPIMYQ